MTGNIIFLLLGIIFGFFGNVILIYLQFKNSVAIVRVKWVAEATEAFKEPANTAMLRDKYRYSLGVIIDDLIKMQDNGYKDNGKWPTLADNPNDRWERFNRYVRPVADDINSYAFLASFFYILPEVRRLRRLTNLCIKIEDVVMRIDAACEQPQVVTINKDGLTPVNETLREDIRLELLQKGYRELYKAWQSWLRSI